MNEDETRNLDEVVHGGDIAMLTTVGARGRMTSRPLTVARVEHDAITFLVDSTSAWVEDLDASPQVNLSVSASGRNDWVSISGPASVRHDAAGVDELWNPAAGAYFDGKDDPKIGVLRVAVDDGEYWSAPGGGPVGRVLAVVGAAVGKPGAVGSHGDVRPG